MEENTGNYIWAKKRSIAGTFYLPAANDAGELGFRQRRGCPVQNGGVGSFRRLIRRQTSIQSASRPSILKEKAFSIIYSINQSYQR